MAPNMQVDVWFDENDEFWRAKVKATDNPVFEIIGVYKAKHLKDLWATILIHHS